MIMFSSLFCSRYAMQFIIEITCVEWHAILLNWVKIPTILDSKNSDDKLSQFCCRISHFPQNVENRASRGRKAVNEYLETFRLVKVCVFNPLAIKIYYFRHFTILLCEK